MLNESNLISNCGGLPGLEPEAEVLSRMLLRTSTGLQDALLCFALDGGAHLFHRGQPSQNSIMVRPIARSLHLSGYDYYIQNKRMAQLRFGITSSGLFLLSSQILSSEENSLTQTSY